jgi:hypothetical protein
MTKHRENTNLPSAGMPVIQPMGCARNRKDTKTQRILRAETTEGAETTEKRGLFSLCSLRPLRSLRDLGCGRGLRWEDSCSPWYFY